MASRSGGDVNGDGLADVAVRIGIDGDEDAGSVQVVLGRGDVAPVAVGMTGTPGSSFIVAGGFAGMLLGQSIAPADVLVAATGDVGGDRRPDVLVLARGRRDQAAGAWLYSLKARREATYTGLINASEARIAGRGAGDVVGGPRRDLVLGSPGTDRAYILG
jgi:hypothetical protein